MSLPSIEEIDASDLTDRELVIWALDKQIEASIQRACNIDPTTQRGRNAQKISVRLHNIRQKLIPGIGSNKPLS
jgi:hypothetical protein